MMTVATYTQPTRTRWLVAVAWGALMLVLAPAVPPSPVQAASLTVVSFTFDDNHANQWEGARILAHRGMAGTFYANSGRVNRTGYLSGEQLRAMEASGHEIAGHTIGHLNLTAVEPDEARRQVCDDRAALTDMGLRITSFAYPFSAYNAEVKAIVEECGYNSGRAVGGIQCTGCRHAESLPPRDRWAIETPVSVKTTTTLEVLQGFITEAVQGGGGWVVLVLHDVCDGCSTHAIAPATLAALADWVKTQPVEVRTVDQVVGGPVQPVVHGPPGNNQVLRNASLEEPGGLNGAPYCWWFGGFGNNTHAWTKLTGAQAHTGEVAYRVDVSGYVDGDRRLQPFEDTGACSLAVTPGHQYRLGAYYRTNGRALFAVRGRDASGFWQFLFQQPFPSGQGLPQSDTWTEGAWITPPIPEGIEAITFYISLRSNGYLATDTYSFVDISAADPGPDPGDDPTDPGGPTDPDDPGGPTDPDDPEAPAPPTLTWQSPSEGSTVKGNVRLVVSAAAEEGVEAVHFLTPDGQTRAATAVLSRGKNAQPTGEWELTWDSTLVSDGSYVFEATVTDTVGARASAERSLVVRNAKGGGKR